MTDISWHKRALAYSALKYKPHAAHLEQLKLCKDQGRPSESTGLHPDSSYFIYNGSFLSFPQYRFALKARLNLLPVRTVQARCGKPHLQTSCRRCGQHPETLAHVLNHCHYHLGMIRTRHNMILERLIKAIPPSLGHKFKEQPAPRIVGDNRPDLTIISEDGASCMMVEVSMPFEGSPQALAEAWDTKITKYRPLCDALSQRFKTVTFLPFIVGSLGSWFPPNYSTLRQLHIGHHYANLMRKLCVASAIEGSQAIWYASMCTRR